MLVRSLVWQAEGHRFDHCGLPTVLMRSLAWQAEGHRFDPCRWPIECVGKIVSEFGPIARFLLKYFVDIHYCSLCTWQSIFC